MNQFAQVFDQLDRLGHISVEYSSTLYSYRTMADIITIIKDIIQKEITNRQNEIQHFSTEQGIGVRKIMFQHYQRIVKIIESQHNLLVQVAQSIYEKHKAMENSLNFIEPIMNEIQHKTYVLDKQLLDIKDKINKLSEKKLNRKQSFSNFQSFLHNEKNQVQSQIFDTQEKVIDEPILSQKNSQSFSLFSPRKFNFLETETQFSQVESFLNLKLQEIQEYIKIEEQLTKRTLKKIFQIFDETMGKGLEKLEKLILDSISEKNVKISIPLSSLKSEQKNISESSSSIDLSCYESLEEVMRQNTDLEKFRFVRKRLYESFDSKIEDKKDIDKSKSSSQGQEFGISPTFKFSCPLIIQSVEQISQFNSQTQDKNDKDLQQAPKDQEYYFYGSFCKENINTINK